MFCKWQTRGWEAWQWTLFHTRWGFLVVLKAAKRPSQYRAWISHYLRELSGKSPFWAMSYATWNTSGTTQKLKKNTEILAHLVTIFHQSFQFLEYIKHVEFNSTLYMFLQVCSCYRTRSWILTKTSQRKEREACYKQQSSTTQWMPNMFSSLSVDVFWNTVLLFLIIELLYITSSVS